MQPRFAMRPEPTLAQRLAERFWALIVHREVDLLEVTYGVALLIWGSQLLLPGDSFSSGIGYRVMAQLAPESVWGQVFVLLGVTKIGAYLLDFYPGRLVATLLAVMLWTFLSVAFGAGNLYGLGIVFCPVFAFTSAIIFWRLVTHRVDDR